MDACAEIGQLLEFGELRRIRRIRESYEEFFFEFLCDSGILEDMVCCYCQSRLHCLLAGTNKSYALVLEAINGLLFMGKT